MSEPKAGDTGTILLRETRGHLRILTINRPERMNSMSPELTDELIDAFVEANSDPDVRVMVGTPWPSRLGWAFTLVLLVAGGLGGLALLFSGDWGGLWLIAAALASSPMVIAMLNRRPSRRMDTAMLAASSGYRNLLAS